MEKLLDLIYSSIDITFMLSVNVLTYIVIKIIDERNKEKEVTKWGKRVVTFTTPFIVSLPLYFTGSIELRVLIYSFILSLISWDLVFRPIIKALKVGYRNEKEE